MTEPVAERNTANQQEQLSEAAKEARRAYRRKWAKANPDKVKSYQSRYWERQAQAAAQDTGTP